MRFLGGWTVALIAQTCSMGGLGQTCCSARPPLGCVTQGPAGWRRDFGWRGDTKRGAGPQRVRCVVMQRHGILKNLQKKLPQNHPTAPAGPLMPCLLSPLAAFGLGFPLLACPDPTGCVSPFLPTLKKSWPRGCGIFNWFCVHGQWQTGFGRRGRGSSPQQRGGQRSHRGTGGPQAPAVSPPLESLCWGSHTVVLCLGSTPWSQGILGFWGKQLDKQSSSWCFSRVGCKEVATKK